MEVKKDNVGQRGNAEWQTSSLLSLAAPTHGSVSFKESGPVEPDKADPSKRNYLLPMPAQSAYTGMYQEWKVVQYDGIRGGPKREKQEL